MKPKELVALIWGVEAGRVRQDPRGRLSFTYDAAWRRRVDNVPLSLSMPLAAAEHGHDLVEAFLWGLLPDNELVLDRWGRKFHVSPRNAFALISHVGEDCAGAVQFALPERVNALRGAGEWEVQWITEGDVAERLRTLRQDHAAWRIPTDTGQFSLAGSQPKTALLYDDGRWGVPSGRAPTTHILKPPTPGLEGLPENEHLCLQLARALGLAAAESEVRRFGDEVAIVVTRYDRVRADRIGGDAHAPGETGASDRAKARAKPSLAPNFIRLHQEDTCQALGVRPTLKYQNEGGPSPLDIVELLRESVPSPAEDVGRFVDALAFNWLIGGTDAHAKNYSLLHGSGGRVRLAPLYDLASALPYPELDPRRIQLAMKIGSEYRIQRIGRRHWEALATELSLDPAATVARVARLAVQLAEELQGARDRVVSDGLVHPVVDRLCGLLAARARHCGRALGAPRT